MQGFKVPPKVYFKRGAVDLALRELTGKKRAFIVTARFLFNTGVVSVITKILDEIGIGHQMFFDIKSESTLATIHQALEIVKPYEPDVFIAIGGGAPMDAAKIMKFLYEQPDADLSHISPRFTDITKDINKVPLGSKRAVMVCIPTTSGTGSEVTPFSIITDEKTRSKYAISDYSMTPDMAIIDSNFTDKMPPKITASSGIDALVHSLEAYVSCMATNFTNSNAIEATRLVFRYLPRAYKFGAKDPIAREKMHYAATVAGMAFANAFSGLCHPMAHKLGSVYNIPYGIAAAMLIRQIIKFNIEKMPEKFNNAQLYKFANAKAKYSQIADELKLGGSSEDEKVQLLIDAISQLMEDIELPKSIKEFGISENDFMAHIDILSENIFENQTSGKNFIYPVKDEIKQIFLNVYNGTV